MRTVLAALIPLATVLNPLSAAASTCPSTVGQEVLGSPLPKSEHWHGSQALAVTLPEDGVWPTTAPGANIAVKLFWWSAGFRPGMESNLNVTVKELTGAPVTAVVSRPTNAQAESLGGWTMLTGIDFPEPGCWQITGKYLGQELTFVVETVRADTRQATQPTSKIDRGMAAIE